MNPAEMFDQLPQEVKEQLRSMAKEAFASDGDMLRFLEFEEDLDSINNQICNTLGLMKSILSRFDEKATSNDRALQNLNFFGKFMTIVTMPLKNLGENVNTFHAKYSKKEKGESAE